MPKESRSSPSKSSIGSNSQGSQHEMVGDSGYPCSGSSSLSRPILVLPKRDMVELHIKHPVGNDQSYRASLAELRIPENPRATPHGPRTLKRWPTHAQMVVLHAIAKQDRTNVRELLGILKRGAATRVGLVLRMLQQSELIEIQCRFRRTNFWSCTPLGLSLVHLFVELGYAETNSHSPGTSSGDIR